MPTIEAGMPMVDGAKLKELREDRFYSYRELAALAGLSPATVLNLESGSGAGAQRRTIRKLAEALGVDPHELVVKG